MAEPRRALTGVRHILKDKAPDLVLPGINRGANMAEDVTYSGTIAGAFEGPSWVFARWHCRRPLDSKAARRYVGKRASRTRRPCCASSWRWSGPPSSVVNINFPDREPDNVAGTMVTTQGRRDPGLLNIDERHDTWGNPYYWLAFERRRSNASGRHRPGRRICRLYLGDAALPRPHAPGHAGYAGAGSGEVSAGRHW